MIEKERLKDPLGAQPAPTRGDLLPDYSNRARGKRVAAVIPFFKTNYIEHEPQTAVVEQLLTYLASTQSLLGGPIDGRCLSEHSNAGKSRMIEQLVKTAAARRAEAGLAPNPYQIIVFELDKTTSVNAFYRRILLELGDDHWDAPAKLDELEERILHLSRKLEVEGLVGDEVQHLDRKTTDARQVTDRFKTFLNRGILPLILVGDEDAEAFFDKNPKFASRLGTPLALKPLNVQSNDRDRVLFLRFCKRLDQCMFDAAIVDEQAGLGEPGMRTQLSIVSGGHVGRICRLVCEATQHALWRGSPAVERHDFSVATRKFAMKLKWVSHDPFSAIDDVRLKSM
ncbi:TniB family NTP-binding protein [Sphingomonas sp. MMS24-J45]|uniref:TniB family NTP-binding protein n=1 Tax=Sphingomonas sp. MMS24-J45 TaxID=3238806 RepID=UPI00384CD3D2